MNPSLDRFQPERPDEQRESPPLGGYCKRCQEYFVKDDELDKLCDWCESHSECCDATIVGESKLCSKCKEICE